MTFIRSLFADPARRLLMMIGGLIVLVVMAIGVSVWRFDVAIDADRSALEESQVETAAQKARVALALKSGLVGAYGGDKDPQDLRGIALANKDFDTAAEDALAGLDDDEERQVLSSIIAAEAALSPIFEKQVKPVAGTPRFDAGVWPYTAALNAVSQRLDRFASAEHDEALELAASATSEASRARTIAFLAGGLAVLLAGLIALHSTRLVRRLFGRIDDQLELVDDQVHQLELIRSTAARLGTAAGEMRAAANETASATNEQSAAIAVASTFIGSSRLPKGVDGDFWSCSEVGDTWPLVRP